MLVDVATMSWEDLKKYVYYEDGSLPDILVLNTSRDDWRKWVDFVNTTYRVVFRDEHEQKHAQVNFAALAKFWDSNGEDEMYTINIFVGSIQINGFYNTEDDLVNDIDSREIKSMADHIQLLDYLKALSKMMHKKVLLLAEGTRTDPVNEWDPEPLLVIDQDYACAYTW